jgi:ABC-type ATPase involved in cell division
VPGSDDHFFRELLVKVFNMILIRLADARITEKEAEEIGSALRRVYIIFQDYKLRKKQYTITQWLDMLMGAAKEVGISV